jgi:hypothetical protein
MLSLYQSTVFPQDYPFSGAESKRILPSCFPQYNPRYQTPEIGLKSFCRIENYQETRCRFRAPFVGHAIPASF